MVSLDALRGFVMLFIIGLGSILWQLGHINSGTAWGAELRLQMGHAAWQGLHAYDLIFPLFVYYSGVAQNFSLRRRLSEGSSSGKMLLHLWVRAGVLVVLGWVVNGALVWEPQHMRYASVLGLIGISGALAGTLAQMLRRTWGLAAAAVLILVGIAAAQYWGGELTPSGCINARVDAALCPGKLHNIHYDPEGPLCILSATALSLLGYLSGRVFCHSIGSGKRLLILAGCGVILSACGLCLPVIKNIWTPGFVLAAGGIGALLLALFHLLCDIWQCRPLSLPLRVVGTNALFIYLFTHIFRLDLLAQRLFAGTFSALLPTAWQGIALSCAYLLPAWGLCCFLYRRGIFIRV